MIEIVERATFKQHNMIVIDQSNAIWLTFCASWWDIAPQIVWLLQPGKRAWLQLKITDKDKTRIVRVQAKRISKSYVRIGDK